MNFLFHDGLVRCLPLRRSKLKFKKFKRMQQLNYNLNYTLQYLGQKEANSIAEVQMVGKYRKWIGQLFWKVQYNQTGNDSPFRPLVMSFQNV